ncbi:MAG: CBS domain-containing protein [Cyclobacteriaceae bacterium]|nr:CBS domain-containing protein [Cyclobacteriaceae bacterium]
MNDYANDIERYRKGTMTNAERHAFEKKVLTDPFLAEALEGAELIAPDEFAVKALHQMQDNNITQLVVVNPDQQVEGFIHLHDLLKEGIV